MSKYDNTRLAWVVPSTGSEIKYGFRSNIDEATATILGHTIIAGEYPVGLVIGANSPKPPRASRRQASGYQSSWCSSTAVVAARAAGFTVRAGKRRRARSSSRSATVYVSDGGLKLAWNIPRTTYQRIIQNDLTALGIKTAGAGDEDLVFGQSYPKKPRVSFFASGADGVDIISTYADPSKLNSLPNGWSSNSAGEDVF
jgi:hypothetical protein